ncbi:hypothetical protein DFJ74DRAFT_657594 [Hyaloraphidium curvatum]|nr:hypothetical protein DFJ74DRAFT_657594 [Hyaloraphidium curvatum]
MGALLKAEMEKVKAKHRVIGDVRGLGLLMAVEIVKDKDTKEMFELGQAIDPLYRFQEIAEDNGLLLYVRRTAGGIFGACRPATCS